MSGLNPNAICVRCNTDLTYSTPAKETNTTTKRKIEGGYYNCNNCDQAIKERRKQDREKKKQAKTQKQFNIKRREETNTQKFGRLWRDVDENEIPLITVDDQQIEIVNLPEHRRLMWIYKRHDIRSSNAGYLAYEEAKIIRHDQIQNITESAMEERHNVRKAEADERISKEDAAKKIRDIESWEKTQIKKQIAYVDKLHTKANKEWETRPETEWERMVKEPGHRDPEGNKAPRYHLLSDKPTFYKRQSLRNRQIVNIQRVDQLEDRISDKNQKKLFEGENESEDQGQESIT